MNDAINKDFQGNSLTDFQLEPCPFCGCPVKMQKISIRTGWWYGVACRSGDGYGGSCAMEQVPSRTIEAAAKRWNMRKPMEALIAENEAMAEFKAHMIQLREVHGFDSWAAVLVEVDRLKAENEALRKDAGRWRAFINCARIKFFGWAGYGEKDPYGNSPGNYRHFGGEFWTIHDAPTADKEEAAEILNGFADAAIAAKGKELMP